MEQLFSSIRSVGSGWNVIHAWKSAARPQAPRLEAEGPLPGHELARV